MKNEDYGDGDDGIVKDREMRWLPWMEKGEDWGVRIFLLSRVI